MTNKPKYKIGDIVQYNGDNPLGWLENKPPGLYLILGFKKCPWKSSAFYCRGIECNKLNLGYDCFFLNESRRIRGLICPAKVTKLQST